MALGDSVHLTPEGLAELDGVVDWLSRDFLGVRTDDGIYRFMHISVFGGPTGVGHHIFVDGLDQATPCVVAEAGGAVGIGCAG